MSGTPLVSILVGFLDAEQYLEETVAGVLDQTLDDWELLLVDDGSSDGSSAIAKRYGEEYPDRIRYLCHPGHRNRGVCASRNLALANARGRYVAILDADDVWEPEKLSEQADILATHPTVGMTYGAALYWRSWRGGTGRRDKDYTPSPGVETETVHRPPALLRRCHPLGRATAPCPSDILLRRELVEAVKGFEEQFTGPYQMYEDQAFLAKIYLSAPVFVSSRTWTRYRLHPDSCCYRVESSGMEPLIRRYYLDWLDDYLRTAELEDPGIRRALARARFLSRNPGIARLIAAPAGLKQGIKKLLP